jgi:hypothetical protein
MKKGRCLPTRNRQLSRSTKLSSSIRTILSKELALVLTRGWDPYDDMRVGARGRSSMGYYIAR